MSAYSVVMTSIERVIGMETVIVEITVIRGKAEGVLAKIENDERVMGVVRIDGGA